jgi:predicted nucleic-acid-binding Zn-ribbon protein
MRKSNGFKHHSILSLNTRHNRGCFKRIHEMEDAEMKCSSCGCSEFYGKDESENPLCSICYWEVIDNENNAESNKKN